MEQHLHLIIKEPVLSKKLVRNRRRDGPRASTINLRATLLPATMGSIKSQGVELLLTHSFSSNLTPALRLLGLVKLLILFMTE
jgi:hypothetical protein